MDFSLFSFPSLPFHLITNKNCQTTKSELVHMHFSKSDDLKFIPSFPNCEAAYHLEKEWVVLVLRHHRARRIKPHDQFIICGYRCYL